MTTQSYFPKTEADRIIWLLQSWYLYSAKRINGASALMSAHISAMP